MKNQDRVQVVVRDCRDRKCCWQVDFVPLDIEGINVRCKHCGKLHRLTKYTDASGSVDQEYRVVQE